MTQHSSYHDNDLPATHPRRILRDLPQAAFVELYGSGTLRKSARLGFDIQEAYLQERAQLEFGLSFEVVSRSRVTYSDIKLVPCAALTELGWHAERMVELRPFESDSFVCKQFEVEYADGQIKEGVGILVKSTSASWVPKGSMVLAFVAQRKAGVYLAAENPF